jgi:hypothetical protein
MMSSLLVVGRHDIDDVISTVSYERGVYIA